MHRSITNIITHQQLVISPVGLPRLLEYSLRYSDEYSSRKLLVSGSPNHQHIYKVLSKEYEMLTNNKYYRRSTKLHKPVLHTRWSASSTTSTKLNKTTKQHYNLARA